MEESKAINYLQEIYDLLKKEGYDVYFPGQHKGDCIRPYIVVKYDGAIESYIVSSDRPIYTLLCYVPYNMYSSMVQYVYDIKEKMRALYPSIQYAGNETGSVYDEDVKGYMVSFMYQGIRKILLS